MNENVLQTIRAGMDGFSKGQKRIAAFILDNYDRAAFMTAARLGETTSVSESTVVRFAAQLGYDGYPEMQKALQELIRGKLTSIQRIQVSRDQMSGADILGSVMQRDMNSIHNVIDRLDRDAFSCAVDKLLGAKHIYILGVRSSSFLAGYLFYDLIPLEDAPPVPGVAMKSAAAKGPSGRAAVQWTATSGWPGSASAGLPSGASPHSCVPTSSCPAWRTRTRPPSRCPPAPSPPPCPWPAPPTP